MHMRVHVAVILCLVANHECCLTLPWDERTEKQSWSRLSPLGHRSQHSWLHQKTSRVYLLTLCISLLFIFQKHFIN